MDVDSIARTFSSTGTSAPGTIAYARTCYRHMAGWFGVAVMDALVEKSILTFEDAAVYSVTPHGIRWFKTALGIEVPMAATPGAAKKLAFPCLDWTERRPHLAGWLGRALYQSFLERGWIQPTQGSRMLHITPEGKSEVVRIFNILCHEHRVHRVRE